MASGDVGEFLVPCADPSVNMHFDFRKPVSGRVFIFEVLGTQPAADGAGGRATAAEFEGMHNFVKALASTLRLYRYTIAQQ